MANIDHNLSKMYKKCRMNFKILLLVPKPTWDLVPRCHNKFQLWWFLMEETKEVTTYQ